MNNMQKNLVAICLLALLALPICGCQVPQLDGGRAGQSTIDFSGVRELVMKPFQFRSGKSEPESQDATSDGADSGGSAHGYPVQQSAWQPQESNNATAQQVPAYIAEQDAQIQAHAPRPKHPVDLSTQNQLRQSPPANNNGFIADDVRLMPKTATERVIELNGEVAQLRSELDEFRQMLQQNKLEKQQWATQRHQLETRIVTLEKHLIDYQAQLNTANQKSAEIHQRIQIFRDNRQRQITELNGLVDQLERQLQAKSQNAIQTSTGK